MPSFRRRLPVCFAVNAQFAVARRYTSVGSIVALTVVSTSFSRFGYDLLRDSEHPVGETLKSARVLRVESRNWPVLKRMYIPRSASKKKRVDACV